MTLPDGWKKVKLSDCAERITSGGTPKIDNPEFYGGNIPFLKIDDITQNNGFWIDTAKTYITQKAIEETSAKLYPENTVLITMYGTIGSVAITAAPLAANQAIAAFLGLKNTNVYFLANLLIYHSLGLAKKACNTSQANISGTILKNFDVMLPPLPEQEKIAEILGTVDAAIEATQDVIDQTARTKKALMTALLQGKKDTAGNITPWEKVRFSEVTRELKKRNSDGALGIEKVMGVNKVLGIVPMRRETIGSSLDRYKILPPNAFAYNPMRLNIGSLAMCNKTQPVMVSPDYVVFECRENVLNPSYFNHFRRSPIWDRFMEIAGNGSVRIRIYYKDLASLRLPLPSLEEQGKIVKILDGADTVQATNQDRLNQLKKLKTALMQALLTGAVRVPVQTTIQHTNQHKEVVNG